MLPRVTCRALGCYDFSGACTLLNYITASISLFAAASTVLDEFCVLTLEHFFISIYVTVYGDLGPI